MVVGSDGKGLVGHAGAVLLRKCADRTGLTSALNKVLPRGKGPGWWDRGTVLVCLAVVITLGATSMSDIGLLAHQRLVFGDRPSESTVRRALAGLNEKVLKRVGKARAKVRAHVWALLARRPQGFPWLTVAGKLLTGWVVIDMDATLITAHSDKQGAAATFKKGYGFHPLGAWCANTAECLAMLLRPGNAGSNTVADHIRVLGDAIAQLPAGYRRKLLIRVDGAGATHELLEHLERMNRVWRSVRFTVGWTITAADETAIEQVPADAWTDSLHQDGTATGTAHVAELTGLNPRLAGWTGTLRLLVRRTRPSARHARNLTALEKRTGWRYQIVATNITRIAGVPGSHQPQWLDALHRAHAGVEDHVRHGKATGLRNLPSKDWTVNQGWTLTCNIAADLAAWTRLLGLYDQPDLAHAEPDTLRYRLLHLPARLATHARRRVLSIPGTWPWADAFTLCWRRLTLLPPAT
ncbi:IS1380 family transposase [Plantactinospora sp. KBS50]|nr:IS1380 family transposase [Plantactinospora sp. KBS50]ASW57656.1 IS1380 family transposase [Plantactinospora sp. KBS50]ASW57810.1 IS1380 family transposase [Plantactinospora sp. KBS50]ASW57821.1 IS1380 family transposase [Plantactinospora sp. KBS50]